MLSGSCPLGHAQLTNNYSIDTTETVSAPQCAVKSHCLDMTTSSTQQKLKTCLLPKEPLENSQSWPSAEHLATE